ncbi:MAG: hypothetical protein AB8G86_04795 [Saprospiraceae bacterium]
MQKYSYLRPYDKSLSPVENLQKAMLVANEILGEPVSPSSETIKEQLEQTRNILGFCSPRTFIQVFDVSTTSAVFSYGLELLGYGVDYRMTGRDAINFTHENQRSLFAYQTAMVYRIFLEEPELVYNNGTVYSTTRSLKTNYVDKKDEPIYWVVNQLTTPLQYDSNGRMVRYLSSYRILGEYKGEAFETALYTDPKYKKEQTEIRKRLRWIKVNMLEGLGFTRKQKEVIEYTGEGIETAAILQTMGIQKKGLDKHRRWILAKGKELFPENDFEVALDVIKYLKKQGII